MQRRLDELGYAPVALGYDGVASASAIRAFQSDQGLEVDGVVGLLTRAALDVAEPRGRDAAHASAAGAGVRAGKAGPYVPTSEAWLRATGQRRGRTRPLPGDIAILDLDGGQPDHIGIVERDLGDGRFLSIEGNTSSTNDSDGGAVERRTRRLDQVTGFGRVD